MPSHSTFSAQKNCQGQPHTASHGLLVIRGEQAVLKEGEGAVSVMQACTHVEGDR
jgi:hypothetical protein